MMSIHCETTQFERLADEIGAAPAALLCAFFGANRRPVYVPSVPSDDHILARLIGRRAFADLCASYGGQTIQPPALDLEHVRIAGLVHALGKAGIGTSLMAAATKLTPRRIQQVRAQLSLEGLGDLINVAEADTAAALADRGERTSHAA